MAGALKDWNENTFGGAVTKKNKALALCYIGSMRSFGKSFNDQVGKDVLEERLLPHIGSSERSKALYLGYMVHTVVSCFLGRQRGTDRHDWKNKRLEFAGETISHQFRKLMGQVIKQMKIRMLKRLSTGHDLLSFQRYVSHKVITTGLKTAFSSGIWNGHDTIKTSCVVFSLQRDNPLSTLSQLREIRQLVPAPAVRVDDEARRVSFSQWGGVCPVETPDGEGCGLVKNMALTGVVSCVTPEEPILKLFADSNMEELGSVDNLSRLQGATKIFLNGRWMGIVVDIQEADMLVNKIRKARRTRPAKSAKIDLTQVGVVQDNTRQEIHISTDGGRILRPLLVVEDQALVLTEDHVVAFQNTVEKKERFRWLLSHGAVELLGMEEEEKAVIALHGEQVCIARHFGLKTVFTHAELHVSLLMGLSASLIPFPNHNEMHRNLFQARKHSKQAIGFYVTNISSRADTSGHQLLYPQKQLVKTNAYEVLQKPEMFNGQNAVVAVASYTGYNQEDSIIMNQSSLDRGMFRTAHYQTFESEERKDKETFGKPSLLEAGGATLARSLEKLDDDGLPYIGAILGERDIIVGKVCKSQSNVDSTSRLRGGRSLRLKAHEKGRVTQVVMAKGDEGQKVAKVTLIQTRMPQIGDKFSSMHGQKGVIGMVYTQEDLPFSKDGIVPDIVINPHAFPSRQTLGQMWENSVGKVVATTAEKLFGTPFNPSFTVESVFDSLHRAGYKKWGEEMMHNGFSGESFQANIFIGCNFYQRLTHFMVEDVIKYRSRGPVQPLTRQPVADSKRAWWGQIRRDGKRLFDSSWSCSCSSRKDLSYE
ncbi:unnamed protein product [Calypogeia fissa]